jgi:Domain of unknown function (DUF4082)
VGESFHTDTEVPAGTNFNDSAALSMGLYFTVGVDGTVTHARWRAADSVTGTVKWGLYRLSDSLLLGSQSFTTYTQGAWNTVALNTPIAITAATRYAAVYWSQTSYVATSAYFTTAITRGSITAEASGGRFVEPSADITLPTNSFNNGCYFVDLVFSSGSAVTPTGLAVPVALGQPTVSQALTVSPTGIAVPATFGQPTVVGQPYVQQLTGGSWWELESILAGGRAVERWWQTVQPLACPNDGEPLKRSVDGILYCPYDNWRPDNQISNRRRPANLGRDWGGLRGIRQAAAQDAAVNQLLLSCPNDGEPLSIGADGTRFCRYDGWMPPPNYAAR